MNYFQNSNKMKKIGLTILLYIALVTNVFCQSSNVDFIHSIGKIYVVVAVIAATFIGIIFYLISLDKKLTKLENQIKK